MEVFISVSLNTNPSVIACRMRKYFFVLPLLAILLLTACKSEVKVGSASLSLEFTDSISTFLACWCYDKDCVVDLSHSFKTVDAHTAVLTVDSVVGFVDVDVWTIYTHAGVRLVPGDTIHLKFTPCEGTSLDERIQRLYPNGDVKGYYRVECLNPVKKNDIVDAIMQTFNGSDMLFYAMLGDAGVDDSPYLHALPELEQRFADFHSKYDRRLDKHLADLVDIRRGYMLKNMLCQVSKEQGISEEEIPGADWYYAFIQPNNLAHAAAGFTTDWMEHEVRKIVSDEAMPQFSYAILEMADSLLSNPAKTVWLDDWSRNLFGIYSIPVDKLVPLWKRYVQCASDCPEILKKWQKTYEKLTATASGKLVKDITLQTPDGADVQLSSLFGKLLYIDVWATWCVPCCAEIPYLDELVGRFKDNDKVAFLSFSIDKTADPWLEKIRSDQPAWPQYHLSPEQKTQFCNDWDIRTIPRFIMIAPDGTICDAHAPRPSKPNIADYIEECIGKYKK